MLRNLLLALTALLATALTAACAPSANPVPVTQPTAVATSAAAATTAPTTAPAATTAPTKTSAPTATTVSATATALPTATEAASPTSEPTETASADATETPLPAGKYDGDWEGNTASGSPISFSIAQDKFSYVNLNFAVTSGACDGLSGSYGTTPDAAVEKDAFNVNITDSDGGTIEFTGKLTSPTEASGTLHMQRKASCGAFEVNETWTAKLTPPTPEATTPEGTPAGSAYDGDWEGTSSTDSPISFTIADGQLNYATLNFQVKTAPCSGLGGTYGAPIEAAIANDTFDAKTTDSEGGAIEFAGKFTSPTTAAGTLYMKRKANCGAYEINDTWTAKLSSPAADATPAGGPTSADVTPGAETDGAKLVTSFFDALNAGNVDAAMALVDPEPSLMDGTNLVFGHDDLTAYLQKQVKAKTHYTVSDLQDLQGVVIFTLKVNDGAPVENDSAVIEKGKIQILTLHTQK